MRHGQIAIDNGVITAVGANLGTPTHVFGDHCLIFAGMGDIHIHAREDVTARKRTRKPSPRAAAAALHGGVLHVADMPNNPAAPIDDASYAAKEALVEKQQSAGRLHALCRHRAGDQAADYEVFPTRRTWARASAICFSRRWNNSTQTLANYAGQAVSFHCEDPLLLEKHKAARDA